MRQQLWKCDLDFLFLPIFLALVFKKMPGQGERGVVGGLEGWREDRKSGGEESRMEAWGGGGVGRWLRGEISNHSQERKKKKLNVTFHA